MTSMLVYLNLGYNIGKQKLGNWHKQYVVKMATEEV